MSTTVHNTAKVAVTGAAGQIGYSLLFRIASGEMLGKDQPVILQLLEITPALNALKGVVMELEDCAFPLLTGLIQSDDPKIAFKDADIALLVGARPRSKGMERKDFVVFVNTLNLGFRLLSFADLGSISYQCLSF